MSDLHDDKQLVKRALGGDERCFGLLVARYKTMMYNTAYRYMLNKDDALDVCQDVMVTILRKGHQYQGQAPLQSWIRAIVKNTSKNAIRRKIHQHIDADLELEQIDVADERENPTLQTEKMQHSENLHRCMKLLPEKQRMTVALRVQQDLTLREVADIMHCSHGTAKANFFHAMTKLKLCMEKPS